MILKINCISLIQSNTEVIQMKIMSNKKYNSLTNYIVQCDEERKILKAHNRELEKQIRDNTLMLSETVEG